MRDVLAGILIIGFALLFLVPGLEYGVGTVNRPGAGGLPVVAAAVMIAFGVMVGLTGFQQRGSVDQIVSINLSRVRHIALVAAAILGFAFSIERVGLIPATVIVVVLASLADRKSRAVPTIIVAAVISVVIWLIFKVGLNSSVPLFERPF